MLDMMVDRTYPRMVLHHLFVYGEMKRGGVDHHVLQDKPGTCFIGEAITEERYDLVTWRDSPNPTPVMFCARGSFLVRGELFHVSAETLAMCDDHIGHPHPFHRTLVRMKERSVWVHLFNIERHRTAELTFDGITIVAGVACYALGSTPATF